MKYLFYQFQVDIDCFCVELKSFFAIPRIIKLAVITMLSVISSFMMPQGYSICFQAFMTDGPSNRFGLRVVGNRSPSCSKTVTQYPIQVGECKPRRLQSGKISIQLKSGMFEADESVGESPGLLRKLVKFNGNDFDVHFACIFKCNATPDLFGKVEIKAVNCIDAEEISFNLMKRCPRSTYNISQNKMIFKDLIGLLSIHVDTWKMLATSLGYTQSELEPKLSQSDSIEEILSDFICRGGSEDEFMNAMIKVANIFKILPFNIKANLLKGNSDGKLKKESSCSDSPGTRKFAKAGSKRKYDERLSESKLDDIAKHISFSWKSIGRKLNVPETELKEIELNNCHIGEREKAFQMLIHWRESDPKNCLASKLSSVLIHSGFKFTAMQCLQ